MTAERSPPLLETRGLCLRFGGLTALDSIDLRVTAGQICSVIGPNGAGKTTLFNCISGVLQPTAGKILLEGRDARRRLGWRAGLAAVSAGLITALVAAGLACNVDGLWRAAIRRPMSFSGRPFTYRETLAGAVSYFRGELAVERQTAGRWSVVTADGKEPLVTAGSREQAERLRRDLQEQLGRIGRGEPADPSLDTLKRDRLAEVSRRRLRGRWLVPAAFLGGLAVGGLGMLSVSARARWTADIVAAAGVARTFQNLRLFKRMTVLENVLVALEACRAAGRRSAEAHRLLELVGLTSLVDRLAGELAYGDSRRLEIARALALRPRLLLLDEPAAGMNATETAALKQLARQIRASGVTVVLIEHEMDLVMGISDHVVVLDYGRKIAEGKPEAIRRDPAVIEAYLGAEAKDR